MPRVETKFCDLLLVAADGTEVPSCRAIMAAESDVVRNAIEAEDDDQLRRTAGAPLRVPLTGISGPALKVVVHVVHGDPAASEKQFGSVADLAAFVDEVRFGAGYLGVEHQDGFATVFNAWLDRPLPPQPPEGEPPRDAAAEFGAWLRVRVCLGQAGWKFSNDLCRDKAIVPATSSQRLEALRGLLKGWRAKPWGVSKAEAMAALMQKHGIFDELDLPTHMAMKLCIDHSSNTFSAMWIATHASRMTRSEKQHVLDYLKRRRKVTLSGEALAALMAKTPCKRGA